MADSSIVTAEELLAECMEADAYQSFLCAVIGMIGCVAVILVLLSRLGGNAALDTDKKPEQVHIAIGETSSDMVITWNTQAAVSTPTVRYGTVDADNRVTGVTQVFIEKGTTLHPLNRTIYVHRVTLENLQPDTKYVYEVGSTDGWSKEFWFQTWPSGTNWSPKLYIYGDMGHENAISLPKLVRDVQKHKVDAIIHVGDFAYNMNTDEGKVGDRFMRMIEPVAAFIPYMVCPGNHEKSHNFSHFRGRFSMPGGTENLYYSFNMGPVHFVSLNTEAYWFHDFNGKHLIVNQYEWLKKDLREANKNREQRPWIVVYGHRPMYCSSLSLECYSDSPTRSGLNKAEYALEPLYKEFGVDIVFSGHQHNYERFWPVYNNEVKMGDDPYVDPKAPVHIVTGSAGCKEYIRYFWPWKKPASAKRTPEYGISEVHFLNGTHMSFKQISASKEKIIDEFMLVKHHHLPSWKRHHNEV